MTNTWLWLLLAAALTACQSPQSRIKKNQAAFDASPPEVQSAIREGRVEVGFTPEQAVMALGKPERVYSQKTAAATQEVWEYGVGGGPRVGLGFGLSSLSSGGSAYSSGVGVNSGVMDARARVRLVFENGRVAVIERRER